MIEGIVLVNSVNGAGVEVYKTNAYIPFIFEIVLTAAYFLLERFVSEDFSFQGIFRAKTENSSKNSEKADDILKYKELLDMGEITQEEYDIKKQELLK